MILKDNGKQYWKLLDEMNQYEVDKTFPSLKRTIERFDKNIVLDDIRRYFEFIDKSLNRIVDEYSKENLLENNFLSTRDKRKDSFFRKWEKNLGKSKQFREVCNDVIGLRIIAKLDQKTLIEEVNKICETVDSGYIKYVDLYNKKAIDDGYRGIHIYYKKNSKSYQIETQFWTVEDYFINTYTHENIYKNENKTESMNQYAVDLRKWIENIPITKEIINFMYYWFDNLDIEGVE